MHTQKWVALAQAVKSLYPQADGVLLAAAGARWELRSITFGDRQLWRSSREADMVTVGLAPLLQTLPEPSLSPENQLVNGLRISHERS